MAGLVTLIQPGISSRKDELAVRGLCSGCIHGGAVAGPQEVVLKKDAELPPSWSPRTTIVFASFPTYLSAFVQNETPNILPDHSVFETDCHCFFLFLTTNTEDQTIRPLAQGHLLFHHFLLVEDVTSSRKSSLIPLCFYD